MKQRQLRHKVLLPARVRIDASWHDVRIVDVSEGGLGLSSAQPPCTGSYLELRRDTAMVICRVAWTSGDRLGVQSQERIDPQILISGECQSQSCGASRDPVWPQAERRKANRPTAEMHKRSKAKAAHIEFAALAGAGAFLSFLAVNTAYRTLTAPLSQVSFAMAN